MKNSKIYCKYIIQFNSIQFNSIPKIISLIALLFLIGCSSNEDPTEDENKERTLSYYAGTWAYDWGEYQGIYFTINPDGSITHRENGKFWDKDETIPATSIKKISNTNFTYSFKNSSKRDGATYSEIFFHENKGGGFWNYSNRHKAATSAGVFVKIQ